MGNKTSRPPGLSDEDAVAARNRFKARLARELGVGLDRVRDGTGKADGMTIVCDVTDEESVIVSYCSSWVVGSELLIRFSPRDWPAGEEELTSVISTWASMQEGGTKFRFYESAQTVTFVFRGQQGDVGALLVPDDVLHGTNWRPETPDEFDESGPLFDADMWPQQFLLAVLLTPGEYALSASLSAKPLLSILRRYTPLRANPLRACCTESADFNCDVQTHRLKTPSRSFSDGLTVDIRVRRNGREIDICTSGRCLAHVLIPLSEGFNKPVIPVGTAIGCMSEGGQSIVRFFSHLEDDVTPITTIEQARVSLFARRYGKHPNLDEMAILPPESQRQFALLSAGELWTRERMIRMLEVHIRLPAPLLADLLNRARLAVALRPDNDWHAQPLILPVVTGLNSPNCGFAGELRHPEDDAIPFSFRFIICGMEYFEDRQIIRDDGAFVDIGDAEEEEEEDDEGLEGGGNEEENDDDEMDKSEDDGPGQKVR